MQHDRILRNALITSPEAFPLATRRRLDLLIGKYFPLETRASGRGVRKPRATRG